MSLGLGERLAAEPRERREAQRRLDPVHVHVLEAGLRVVAAGAHLVVGDRRQRHARPAGSRPPRRGACGVRRGPRRSSSRPSSANRRRRSARSCAGLTMSIRCDAAALDLRAAVAVLGGQPALPDVRRLDDVVVDADDLGQLHPSSSLYVLSRPRRPMRSTVSAHLCPRDFVPGCSATPAVRMAKERSMTSSAW